MTSRAFVAMALRSAVALLIVRSAVAAPIETERLVASDGVAVAADFYPASHPKALILLFHQAGSSKGEYATIAPRLNAAGFDALAIDQRVGGSMFGLNRTAAAVRGHPVYADAERDLDAALRWGRTRREPVILWGSSYSAALVFRVAASHPGEVAAILAFSPGEYLGGPPSVAASAAKVSVPVFVTSSSDPTEIAAARTILAAVRSTNRTQYVPAIGVHGSSTLIDARDPKGAAANWAAVLGFLRLVAPGPDAGPSAGPGPPP